ncbi:pancreatic lipase-related protein 2 isoform X2 [Vanessa atalanta]|uniref:pancreatic lipase-related protein 2 isoform X2 n=1 Tax=Vanessa atalanta TaxID=42275 RepID=UPI001FCDFC9C|nr:pancreatic lipase-related protein 2 isoform X2 [Vanessa atalanta]
MFSSSTACRMASFFIGVTQVCFMPAPVGDCKNCCPRDDKIDIQYKLFTRTNQNFFDIIEPGSPNALSRTRFNTTRPTVIYLFGFSEAATGPSTTNLKNAFLAKGDYNFIAVDWSRLIVFPWYISAVRNTRYMGQRLADFVEFLNSSGVPAGSLHVIGFSLGAEAAGFAGKTLNARGLRLGRITGLDPAYPGYSLGGKDNHLAKDGCSHNRSWRLYVESIKNPTGFPATLCRDWKSATASCRFEIDGYMGFGAQPPMTGKMYLSTNEKPPFAKEGP